MTLHVDGIDQAVFRGTFTPKRRWTVYALPMEQADFGYNDLPARTLEWENRFIDKALAIQDRHPSIRSRSTLPPTSTRIWRRDRRRRLRGSWVTCNRPVGPERALRQLLHRADDA